MRTSSRPRFSDRLDERADRLQDAVEAFRERRGGLLKQLEDARDTFAKELLAVEDWAIEEGLIEGDEWRDETGEPLLPWPRTEVIADPVPDLGTLLRERVADLRSRRGG